MAFLQQEPTTFISVRLTNDGRKELALGRLNFSQAVLSDREVNYEFNRRYPDTAYFANLNPPSTELYDICLNRVMEPADRQPFLPSTNFDGTAAMDLTSKVFVSKQIATAQTNSTGFWSSTTLSVSTTVNDYVLHPSRYIRSGQTTSGQLTGARTFVNSVAQDPAVGNLLLMRCAWPGSTGPQPKTTAPFADFWYRVTDVNTGSSTIGLDRNLPDWNGDTSSKPVYWYEFPWNGIESYYGSASTQNTAVWNLNIVRTSREIGSGLEAINTNTGQSYTTYGSRQYSGQKQYFGFEDDVRQVGFLHYTNQYTGNTYGEQLVPGTTQVDMPNIMWHRANYNPGQGTLGGHRFTDEGSEIYYDGISKSSYTLLKDGTSSNSQVVGRVYYKLKLIVITDPELLTAMSYKTNRNWTLPPLIAGSQPNPKSPLTIQNTSGLLKSDYVYYVTYTAHNAGPYVDGESSGYKPSMHCGYISKVQGFTDENGYAQYLTCTFPSLAFPYLRAGGAFNAYSGTGWSCNRVQILVQEVPINEDKGIDALHPGRWSGASNYWGYGNGVYSGESSHSTIDPTYLQGHQFVISLDDIQSGTTMPNFTAGPNNNLYGLTSGFTHTANNNNTDYLNGGLTYGNEDFFFGNIKTKILSTTYKTVFTIEAKDSDFNSSNNGGFDGALNSNTYITEFGILNEQGILVAVGKPTYPIKKSSARYLTFQLELDF